MTFSSQGRVNKRVWILRWIREDRILLIKGVAVAEPSAKFAQRE